MRWTKWAWMAAAVPVAAAGQEPARLAGVLEPPSGFLFGVTAAAVGDQGRVALLTDPAPAVHVLGGSETAEWGEGGEGPGELMSPADLAWSGAIAILDMGNRRIEVFDEEGTHLHGRRLDLWANRIDLILGDTILGAFIPMTDERAVLRLRDGALDTLWSYRRRGESRRLDPEDGPGYSYKPPFMAQDQWSIAPDGTLAMYVSESNELRYQAYDGELVRSVPVTWEGYRLTEVAREWWFQTAIPQEFMGQRVFEPVRRLARRQVEFPDRLPPVMALEADPDGGVWAKRRSDAEGEVWRLVTRDGESAGELGLPPGRRLLAVGDDALFVLARDELDAEVLEVYRRPDWAS